VWAAVKIHGSWDDTIVVLTSDHAEMMGDHRMLGKGGFFDGSYHIPLIVRDPRRRKVAGRKVQAFTEAVDILPTVLDLADSQAPAHLDGHSLTPFLDGEDPAGWRDAAHWEFDFRSISQREAERHFGIDSRQCNLAVVRTEKFKYVHFGGGLPPVLFDLAGDPDETRNLAGDAAYRAARIEMAERLLAWRAEHLDQSLALSELTGHGVAGTFHSLP
jgi:arylsulfatase A-like enzyme